MHKKLKNKLNIIFIRKINKKKELLNPKVFKTYLLIEGIFKNIIKNL